MISSSGFNDPLDKAIRAVRILIEITELRRSAPAHELRQHLTELLNARSAGSRTDSSSERPELLAALPTP